MSVLKPINNIETAIKIALVFFVIYICFLIFKPFLLPVIWAIIIAVAVYPLHKKIKRLLNNKGKASAIIISIIFLAAIIIPAALFIAVLADSVQVLATQFQEGSFTIPPPPENVASWPVVGTPINDVWNLFYQNMELAITEYKEEIKTFGTGLLSAVSGLTIGLLMLIFAVVLSGVFLVNSEAANTLAIKVFKRLIGEKGEEVAENSKATIRSVVNGVLGTAIIQSAIIAIGFFVADVPGAPILSVLVLVLAIVQLPPALIIIPVVIYMFSIMGTTGAIVFAVWSAIGGLSDNFLKPMLLGRGLEIPMLIILIGSIGGMLLMGIVGLFIGAVILALGYQLFQMWIGAEK